MNFNPLVDRNSNENDSKRTTNPSFKLIAHEGLMPVTLCMLSNCLKEKRREIEGVDLLKVVAIARI